MAGARYSLAAPRRSPLGTAGAQLGRLAGESMEFMDHREYQPGDDLPGWTGRPTPAATRWSSSSTARRSVRTWTCSWTARDSMALDGTEKLRASVALAAALATAADNAGYTRRVYATGQGCRPVAQGVGPPAAWQALAFDSVESPAESLRTLPPAWQPHGIRVLISDLLWLGDPLELLTGMSDRSSAVYVLQVLAAVDADPEALGNARLVDSETHQAEEVLLDAAALARYRRNLQRHCEHWHRASGRSAACWSSLWRSGWSPAGTSPPLSKLRS